MESGDRDIDEGTCVRGILLICGGISRVNLRVHHVFDGIVTMKKTFEIQREKYLTSLSNCLINAVV